jgi:hypothetical protein
MRVVSDLRGTNYSCSEAKASTSTKVSFMAISVGYNPMSHGLTRVKVTSKAGPMFHLNDRLLPTEPLHGCLRDDLLRSTSFDGRRFQRLSAYRARFSRLMRGMQSINGVLDASAAFTAVPLQLFPVNNLHVAAAATDRPGLLKVSRHD